MEPIGAFSDGEWDSFNKMFSTEELDFTAQFLGQCSYPLEQSEGLNFITPSTNSCLVPDQAKMDINESLFFNSNFHFMSQGSSYGSNCSFVSSDSDHHVPVTDDLFMSMDICAMDERNVGCFVPPAVSDIVMKGTDSNNNDMSTDNKGILGNSHQLTAVNAVKELQLKRKFDLPALNTESVDKINCDSVEKTMKKPRVSRDVQKTKKNAQSKKNQKLSPRGNDGEESNAGSDRQSTSSYSGSEDDNASQETNGATSDSKASTVLNLNGKTRASRGAATDPQSLYARKRRERINERLRILQNLVPNGTKVDISTMLEEAVHYVKFLQLQIKLLSSDDLWMYAPICYNGVDVGLNQKLSALL